MFKRTDPTRNPSQTYNILGNPQPIPNSTSNNKSLNPQVQTYSSNLTQTTEGELSERTGNYGRPQTTLNPSSSTLAPGINIQQQQSASRTNVFHQNQPQVSTTVTYQGMTIGTTNTRNFTPTSQTLTPIRTGGNYHQSSVSQIRTPTVTKSFSQVNNTSYFTRQEISNIPGSRTPNNQMRNNSNASQLRRVSDSKEVRLSSRGETNQVSIPTFFNDIQSGYRKFERIVSGNNQYPNPYNLTPNQGISFPNKSNTSSNFIAKESIQSVSQNYTNIANMPGLRKIDPPPGAPGSNMKTTSIFPAPNNTSSVKRQIFTNTHTMIKKDETQVRNVWYLVIILTLNRLKLLQKKISHYLEIPRSQKRILKIPP